MSTRRPLSRREWQERAEVHRRRLAGVLAAHRGRRSRGIKHPIVDFLFSYYRFRPGQLEAWSPGIDVELEEAEEFLSDKRYVRTARGTVTLDPRRLPDALVAGTQWVLDLLRATQSRPAFFGCYGLHEWAMVYRAKDRRHESTPLRLSQEDVDLIVERGPLCCTHFDAFRFYTPDARPLNRHALTHDRMVELEQPGCLHANMDVYRWAFKRWPWVGSDLIARAFLLALDIRTVDMQASPYDLGAYELEPIMIETPAGRARYRSLQQSLSERAAPLRAELIGVYESLLAQVPEQARSHS